MNCHGRYIGHGPIISSVLQLKIVTSSGEVIIASRTENEEVFRAVVGGYGGIGVIAEATLQLADNVKVERQTKLVDVADYNNFFNNYIAFKRCNNVLIAFKSKTGLFGFFNSRLQVDDKTISYIKKSVVRP